MEGPQDTFDTLAKWDLNRGTSRSLDTTTYGTSTIKITANATNTAIRSVARTPYNLSGKTGGVLTVYIPDPSKVREINLYIAADDAFSAFGVYVWRGNSFLKGKNELYFDLKSDLSEIEGAWTGQNSFTAMQVLVAPETGVTADVYCDKIEFITSSVGNVIFTMDDQWSTQYTEAFPILQEYGMKGNIAVISNEVGSTGKMTKAQLQEVYDKGWDLMVHTVNHPDLSTLAKEVQRTEIKGCRQWLIDNGFSRGANTVVYPYGGYNDNTVAVMQEEGITWARSLVDGVDSNPPIRKHDIHTINLITGTPVDYAKKAIDRAIATGSTVVFLNHKYGNTDDGIGMYYSTTSFREIVAYVAAKRNQGKCNVLSVSQLTSNFY
jgi:peptidoglycan/xylan/chitin deacetylase (PgdA/CDA1 family)